MQDDLWEKRFARLKRKLELMEALLEEKTREAFVSAQDATNALHSLEGIFESIYDPFFLTDDQLRITKVNTPFTRKFGYEENEALDLSMDDLFRDAKLLKALDQNEINKSTSTLYVISKNGKSIPVNATMAEIAAGEGGEKYIFFLRDISLWVAWEAKQKAERDRLDVMVRERTAELLREKEKAESANKAKSLFLANMSHEIRTPLNAIVALTSLIMKQEADQVDNRIRKIKISSDALMSLVNDILDFSKIEAGELAIEEVACHFGDLMKDAVAIFEDMVEESRVQLICDIDDKIDGCFLTDPVRVRQVLVNVLSNAVKFTSEGHIRVSATLEAKREDLHVVRVEIEDSGIGIPKDKQAELFKPFIQADFSTTRKFGGTGLGLSICREIIDLMGGRIGVQSKEGQGSTFFFTIPLVWSESCEVPQGTEDDSKTRHAKILVVEDNKMNQDVMSMILEAMGHEFSIAPDGSVAVKQLQQDHYDIVLMDCQMPVMDGFEATQKIREFETQSDRKQTPIIAMTANALAKDRERAFDLGMNDYMTKPVTPESVAEMLKKWLRREPGAPKPAREISRKSVSAIPDAAGEHVNPQALRALQALNSQAKPRFMQETVESFFTTADADMEELTTAVEESNFEAVRSIAHRFKTSCGIVGAHRLQDLCQELEGVDTQESNEGCTVLLEKLRLEFDKVVEVLEPLLGTDESLAS